MRKMPSLLLLALILAVFAGGCSTQLDPGNPQQATMPLMADKNGTETLGDPGILTVGSGIVEGGTGLVTQPSDIVFTVPGTAITRVLLYWSGGTNEDPQEGDDTIEVNGTEIQGELIGGPAHFFNDYYFTAYRADITNEGLVVLGPNTLTISGLDYIGTSSNENDGAGVFVVYEDGTEANIQLRDGLDLAYFDFPGDRQVTVPQTFNFDPPSAAVEADLLIMAGSVGTVPETGEPRPNEIKVTINGSEQVFTNELGSFDGPLWDSLILTVNIPAGATSLTVEPISVESYDPLGASLSWVVGALAVPIDEEPPPEGCTRTKGYWWRHAGFGPQDDMVTALLPQWLGDAGGDSSLAVTTAAIAYDVLGQDVYGHPHNGITKLYAQLLAAKLNIENGAGDTDIADAIDDADAFLADHSWRDWDEFDDATQDMVLDWKTMCDNYNKGVIGPGHCDEMDDDNDDCDDGEDEESDGHVFRKAYLNK